MQHVLPKWMWTSGLVLFATTVLSATDILPYFGLELPRLRLATSAASVAIVILIIFFAGRSHLAPWRILWHVIPKLNNWVFPDLNGVWVGKAQSNWSAIEKLREAASSSTIMKLDDLFDLDRIESPIVVQIRCTIFRIKIVSYQGNTQSKSRSLSTGIERNTEAETYLLSYTYRQENEITSATDSEEHIGASTLEIDYADLDSASGSYWTKRCWEDGRNTAGKISLKRVSNKSDLSTKQLQEFL